MVVPEVVRVYVFYSVTDFCLTVMVFVHLHVLNLIGSRFFHSSRLSLCNRLSRVLSLYLALRWVSTLILFLVSLMPVELILLLTLRSHRRHFLLVACLIRSLHLVVSHLNLVFLD